MITYFPQSYPDELLYSQMARCYVKSGYITYKDFAEDFFRNPSHPPSIEYIEGLTENAISKVTKLASMEDVIMNHTMFPYNVRFATKEERNEAFQALLSADVSYYQIPRFKRVSGYGLKYCPICAKKDREKYGETYWHRLHQIDGIGICSEHKCKLIDSGITMKKSTPKLYHADGYVPQSSEIEITDKEIAVKVAKYITAVFQAGIDMKNDVLYSEYLHYRMTATKYCSARGLIRNITSMLQDYLEYYRGYEYNPIIKRSQMELIFKNQRRNPLEIILLALFLGINEYDITHMKLPEISPVEWFDNELHRLHNQGLKYPEIARRMGASYETVKAIGIGKHDKLKNKTYIRNSGGNKAKDWILLDSKKLPEVQLAILRITNDKESIPLNITVAGIERELGLKNGSFKHMPRCKAEVEKHRLTQHELWAKKVVWSARKIIDDKDILNWKHIRDYTNMRNKDFQACKPFIEKYADAELAKRIKALL